MFKREWLLDPEFADWVSGFPDEEDAYCKLCNKYFRVRNGRSALRSHAKGIKHGELMKQNRITLYPTLTSLASSSNSTVSQDFQVPSRCFETQEISSHAASITSRTTTRERSPIFGMLSSRSRIEEKRPVRYRPQKKSVAFGKSAHNRHRLKEIHAYEKLLYKHKQQYSSFDQDICQDEDNCENEDNGENEDSCEDEDNGEEEDSCEDEDNGEEEDSCEDEDNGEEEDSGEYEDSGEDKDSNDDDIHTISK